MTDTKRTVETEIGQPTSTEELPLLLTVQEVSEVLRIGRGTAYAMVRCGKIRSIKAGKQLRVPNAAIVDLLAGLS